MCACWCTAHVCLPGALHFHVDLCVTMCPCVLVHFSSTCRFWAWAALAGEPVTGRAQCGPGQWGRVVGGGHLREERGQDAWKCLILGLSQA